MNSLLTSSERIVPDVSAASLSAALHISESAIRPIAGTATSSDCPSGEFVSLKRHVRGADHLDEPVYVSRRNVTHILPRGSGCFVFLIGGGSIEVVESAREAAARLS